MYLQMPFSCALLFYFRSFFLYVVVLSIGMFIYIYISLQHTVIDYSLLLYVILYNVI